MNFSAERVGKYIDNCLRALSPHAFSGATHVKLKLFVLRYRALHALQARYGLVQYHLTTSVAESFDALRAKSTILEKLPLDIKDWLDTLEINSFEPCSIHTILTRIETRADMMEENSSRAKSSDPNSLVMHTASVPSSISDESRIANAVQQGMESALQNIFMATGVIGNGGKGSKGQGKGAPALECFGCGAPTWNHALGCSKCGRKPTGRARGKGMPVGNTPGASSSNDVNGA